MIDSIVDALALNIDGSLVLKEKVLQGYDDNTFVVKLKSGKFVKQMKDTHINFYEFSINYYGEDKEEVSKKIVDAIKTISDITIINFDFNMDEEQLVFNIAVRQFSLGTKNNDFMKKIYFN